MRWKINNYSTKHLTNLKIETFTIYLFLTTIRRDKDSFPLLTLTE
jgi:hypothetical protein